MNKFDHYVLLSENMFCGVGYKTAGTPVASKTTTANRFGNHVYLLCGIPLSIEINVT